MISKKEGSAIIVYVALAVYEDKTVDELVQSIKGYLLSDVANGQQFGEIGIGCIVKKERKRQGFR